MTLEERLLRLTLGAAKATALIGDIEEEAGRRRAGRAWVRRQILAQVPTAVALATRRWRARMFTTLTLAVRDARRSIWRFRATSALAVLILTLSVAAGTVTYAVVDGVVLRPLPYADSHRLAALFGTTTVGPQTIVSPADYYAWRERTSSFESLAAYQVWPSASIAGDTTPAALVVATASLFDVLRVRPLLGDVFDESNETKGADAVAVISHDFWRRRFGADPSALGQEIRLSTGAVRVVGVMPPGFGFPVEASAPVALWRPLVVPQAQRVLTELGGRASYLQVIARLKNGIDITQARADVERVAETQRADFPTLYREWRPRTELAIDALTERVAGWMRLVLGAVVALLIIACANVSNLLLTRSARRARDISLRASLGATRGQLFASLLTESFLLAAGAVAGGVTIGYWLLQVVKAALPAGIPRADLIALDGRVLLGAAIACLAATMLSGLVPAWQASRTSLADVARQGAAAIAPKAGRRWQHGFLVAQVALVVLLLSATTLLVASFVRVLRVDLGFEHRNLLSVRPSPVLPASEAGRDAFRRDFNARALESLRAVPGVTSVAALSGSQVPLFPTRTTARITAPGSAAAAISAEMLRVSPLYFETSRVPLLHGRAFTNADRSQPVMIIDSEAARHLFGREDAVGRHVTLPALGEQLVVGVAANVRMLGPEGTRQPQIYRPISDAAAIDTFVIRTATPAEEMAGPLQAALAPLMPAKSPRVVVNVIEQRYRTMTADRRFNAGVMSALGVLAMIIGIGGIYASTATVVAQQTREIGIRMALGASAGAVMHSVTARAGKLLSIGTLIGLAGGWALSGTVRSVVFGVGPTDPVAVLVPVALIAVGGGLAALLPARRAARIDPLTAIRTE